MSDEPATHAGASTQQPSRRQPEPPLSVVVNFHNMRREAQRTLYSLTPAYQRGVADLRYEVLVIDNGSTEPLDEESVRDFGPQFQYKLRRTQSVSPVAGVNEAVAQARAPFVVIKIDGAHILTPGVLSLTAKALQMFARPFVVTVPSILVPDRKARQV
ncbi:MAG: glycosyltransferase family 2 protein [Tepidisphaeraceae bacterium]